MKDSDSTPRAENPISWEKCGPCAWAKNGGPPCYYHSSKFGIGKLTTTIHHAAEVVVDELSGAINDELEEWP